MQTTTFRRIPTDFIPRPQASSRRLTHFPVFTDEILCDDHSVKRGIGRETRDERVNRLNDSLPLFFILNALKFL